MVNMAELQDELIEVIERNCNTEEEREDAREYFDGTTVDDLFAMAFDK